MQLRPVQLLEAAPESAVEESAVVEVRPTQATRALPATQARPTPQATEEQT
jgi:hypothetical protein